MSCYRVDGTATAEFMGFGASAAIDLEANVNCEDDKCTVDIQEGGKVNRRLIRTLNHSMEECDWWSGRGCPTGAYYISKTGIQCQGHGLESRCGIPNQIGQAVHIEHFAVDSLTNPTKMWAQGNVGGFTLWTDAVDVSRCEE